MANDGNRIYIDTNTTPDKGVEIADVQRVLARGANDLGLLCSDQEWNSLGTALQPANKINKWAKFKPTRMAGLNPTDGWMGQQKSVYGSTGYSYGLGFVVYETLSDLRASASGIGWNYEPPRGKGNGDQGTDEWFRLLDFNGYKHNAASPFISLGAPGDTYAANEDTFIAADFMFDTDDSGALDLSDFSLFNNWYFGVAVFCTGYPNLCGRGTAVSPLSYKLTDNYSACKVPMNLPVRTVNDTCTLIPFFTNTAITWAQGGEPAGNHRYVPLPFGSIQITVVRGGLVGQFTFTFSGNGSYVYLPTAGRITINFPAMSAYNTVGSTGTIVYSNIYYQVSVIKISDESTTWVGSTTTMSLTGSEQIAGHETETIIPSGTSKALNNPSGTATIEGSSSTSTLYDFLDRAGGTIQNDYRVFVQMWYYNPDITDYEDMYASFEAISNS